MDAPKRREIWQRRLRIFVHLCLRALAGSTGMVLPDLTDLLRNQPPCLPPGHPERLVPNLPLTDQERALWSQLTPLHQLPP